jgi:hypothetical protein
VGVLVGWRYRRGVVSVAVGRAAVKVGLVFVGVLVGVSIGVLVGVCSVSG